MMSTCLKTSCSPTLFYNVRNDGLTSFDSISKSFSFGYTVMNAEAAHENGHKCLHSMVHRSMLISTFNYESSNCLFATLRRAVAS